MSPDVDSRAAVTSYCGLTFGSLRAINSPWIAVLAEVAPATHAVVAELDLSASEVKTGKSLGLSLRHPDVAVVDPSGKRPLPAVIEVDGSVHDAKSERTFRRDKWYRVYGIPLLVLDDAEVTTGGPWKARVDDHVRGAFPEAVE